MFLKSTALLGFVFALSAASAQADVIEVADGFRVESCGFSSGRSYSVTVERTGLRQGGSVNNEGCVKTTFRDGKVRSGDRLSVSVDGSFPRTEVAPGSKIPPTPRNPEPTIPEPRNPTPRNPPQPREPNQPPTPRPPTPRPPSPTPPEPRPPAPVPEPTLPTESLFTARNAAKNQARMMANRVVAIYGRAEQVLYSYSLGLNQGLMTNPYGSTEEGRNQGRYAGQSEGSARGQSEGQNAGQYAGRASGISRFDAVVDKGTSPDLDPRAPQASTSGFEAQVNAAPTIEELLRKYNVEFIRTLNGYEYTYEGYYARDVWSGDIVSLTDLYRWRNNFGFNRFLDAYNRDEWAFDAWLNYRLGGNYRNEMTYYHRATDPNQTANAREVKEAYRSEFKHTYSQVIDEKWMSQARRIDPVAQSQGYRVGTMIANEHAHGVGYVEGYKQSYRNASVQSYVSAFPQAYQSGFSGVVNQFQHNAVLTGANIEIGTGDGTPFLPYSPINVTIHSLRNAGQVGGELMVKVSNGPVKSFDKKTKYIAASTSSGETQYVLWAGQVAYEVVPNVQNSIAVNIGDYQAQATLTVNFYNVVKALGNAQADDKRLMLQEYIRKNLDREWQQERQDSLLREMLNAYSGFSSAERAMVGRSRENFKSVYGSDPGWLNGKQGRWKQAQEILKQFN